MSSKGGLKRKQAGSAAGGTASRAQRNKLAARAAKRSKPAAARSRGGGGGDEEEERHVSDALFFESDDERAGGGDDDDDLRYRATGRRGGFAGSDDEELDEDEAEGRAGPPPDPHAHETPDEARVRIAKEYLQSVGADVDAERAAEGEIEELDEVDAAEAEEEARGVTRDEAIHARLKRDLAAQRGNMRQLVAHARYDASRFPVARSEGWMRHRAAHAHGASATCIAMQADASAIYTGGKDSNVVAWDVETGRAVYTMYGNRGGKYPHNAGHRSEVLALAVASDGGLLASAGADGCIKMWDTRAQHACVHTFNDAHRGAVNALAFRIGAPQLFSGSTDRTVKIWNVDQMAYVETLYGHTSDVTGLDALHRERCLSVSRDKTASLWKVVESTRVPFAASTFAHSLDCVAMLNDEQFVTGGQDGTLLAWNTNKKKPTSVVQNAHGGNWINCVATQRFTDVVFSGSSDGYVNLYCLESSGRLTNKLNLLHRIPVAGHVNGMVSDAERGRFLALAVGLTPRLGRWSPADEVHAPQLRARAGLQLISLAGVEEEADAAQQAAQEREESMEANGNEQEQEEDEMERQEDAEEEEEEMKPPRRPAAAARPQAQPRKKPTANGVKRVGRK